MNIKYFYFSAFLIFSLYVSTAYAQPYFGEWEQTGEIYSGVIRSLLIDSNGNIFAATYGGGIFYSTDDGDNWIEKNNGLTSYKVNTLATNSVGHIFAGTYDGGIFRSTDNGENWVEINNGLILQSSTHIFSIAVNNNDYIFAAVWDLAMQEGGVYRSTDNGDNWTAINNGLTDPEVHDLAVNLYNFIFAGTIDGAFISYNNGDTWIQIHDDLHDVSTIAIDPDGILFIGTWDGGIVRSTDFGTSWTEINNGLEVINVSSLALNADGRIFAGTWGGGVFQSANNGEIWNEINNGLTTDVITSLTIDSDGYIYAGTQRNGVFRSKKSTTHFHGLLGHQFSEFIERVHNSPEPDHKAIVDSFMNAVPSFPFVEESSIAYFIYRGNANSVTVPGDANEWIPEAFPMTQLLNTNFWYLEFAFESDARLEYKFILDGSNWILDPLNPNKVSGGFGPNSELAMPGYIQPKEIQYNPDIEHGTFFDTLVTSTFLGNTRNIKIYTPPGYELSLEDSFPLVLFNDGVDYINMGSAGNILDNLIAENLIEPVIAVFIPPVNREEEYAFSQTDQYESFIIEELIPYIDTKYRTMKDPQFRAMAGVSFGGLITTQISYNHPEHFGLAALFSPSFWPKDMEVYITVINDPKKNIKWYIDWGTYEGSIMFNASGLKDALLQNNCNVIWNEWHEGHSWGSWRAHLDIALKNFFPPVITSVSLNNNIPSDFKLEQNYPNPFNPVTTIQYSLPNDEKISLKVYNLLGEEVITLIDEYKFAGKYSVQLNADNLSSGIYFYQLNAGSFVQTRKMILIK